jgi:hypothetical protein
MAELFDQERNGSGTPRPGGPLVERLRVLEWPVPSDEVRRRCLEAIAMRLGDQPASAADKGGRAA